MNIEFICNGLVGRVKSVPLMWRLTRIGSLQSPPKSGWMSIMGNEASEMGLFGLSLQVGDEISLGPVLLPVLIGSVRAKGFK